MIIGEEVMAEINEVIDEFGFSSNQTYNTLVMACALKRGNALSDHDVNGPSFWHNSFMDKRNTVF